MGTHFFLLVPSLVRKNSVFFICQMQKRKLKEKFLKKYSNFIFERFIIAMCL